MVLIPKIYKHRITSIIFKLTIDTLAIATDIKSSGARELTTGTADLANCFRRNGRAVKLAFNPDHSRAPRKIAASTLLCESSG